MILHIIPYHFPIHYFVVRSMLNWRKNTAYVKWVGGKTRCDCAQTAISESDIYTNNQQPTSLLHTPLRTIHPSSRNSPLFLQYTPLPAIHCYTPIEPHPSPAIHRNMSLISRLNNVNQAVIEAGFSSLADVLINEISCSSDRGAVGRRAVAFYEQGDSTKLVAAIIGNRNFISQGHREIVDTLSCLLDSEIQALSTSPDSRRAMAEFSPEHIEQFSPNRLADVQYRYAPILTAVLANLAKANTAVGNSTEGAAKQRPRDGKIIVTTAISLLCYARNDLSNALQVWILSRTVQHSLYLAKAETHRGLLDTSCSPQIPLSGALRYCTV